MNTEIMKINIEINRLMKEKIDKKRENVKRQLDSIRDETIIDAVEEFINSIILAKGVITYADTSCQFSQQTNIAESITMEDIVQEPATVVTDVAVPKVVEPKVTIQKAIVSVQNIQTEEVDAIETIPSDVAAIVTIVEPAVQTVSTVNIPIVEEVVADEMNKSAESRQVNEWLETFRCVIPPNKIKEVVVTKKLAPMRPPQKKTRLPMKRPLDCEPSTSKSNDYFIYNNFIIHVFKGQHIDLDKSRSSTSSLNVNNDEVRELTAIAAQCEKETLSSSAIKGLLDDMHLTPTTVFSDDDDFILTSQQSKNSEKVKKVVKKNSPIKVRRNLKIKDAKPYATKRGLDDEKLTSKAKEILAPYNDLDVVKRLKSGNRIEVSCRSLKCVLLGHWFDVSKNTQIENCCYDNQIVNSFFEMIKIRSSDKKLSIPTLEVVNQRLWPKLTMYYLEKNNSSLIKNIAFFTSSMVLFPINTIKNDKDYWTLLVMDNECRYVTYYDSSNILNKEIFIIFRGLMAREAQKRRFPVYDLTEWVFLQERNFNTHINNDDSGAYCCMFADFVSRRAKVPTTIDVHLLRSQHVMEIVNFELFYK